MDWEREVSLCYLELKYCERCGALWLRRAESQESYCRSCFMQMKDSPRMQKPKKNRRAAHRNTSRPRDLQGVAEECTAPIEMMRERECHCEEEAAL